MSTWPEDHKRIAAGALNTLQEARTLSRNAALTRLQPLRRKMQNDHPDDLTERANAWLAVCRLCVELPQSDNDELASLWQDAVHARICREAGSATPTGRRQRRRP